MSSSLERLWIRCILIVFVVTGSLYATLTPVFEASDELWHYPMIQHLSEGNPLPVQVTDPALAGPWKQEASQPPLYYYMGALLTFWIDTSDMPIVRDLNPHVNNGEIRPDGNFNLAVHNNPNLNPWVGTLLAVRVVRFASVLLGAFTVWFTYLIGKEFDPKRPEIALLGAALAGFTPMFLFISGAVNNDNLAIPLASLGILLMIRLIRSQQAVSFEVSEASSSFTAQLLRPMPFGSLLFIGVVIGGAVLTKQGTIGLIPLAWGTAFIASWLAVRPAFFESKTTFSQGVNLLIAALLRSFFALAIVFLPILIVAGWWYWRNIQLYGDLLGWSAFIAVLGERETPAPIAQLWDERWGFMLSYWGLFGGVNVPMATWVYRLLNTILVISIPGGGFYLFQLWRGHQADGPTATKLSSKPILLRLIAQLLDLVVTYFGLVVCILFSGAIVYGLIQWATTTWSSQGRLVFTAMSALNLLWAAALVGWLGDANRRRLALALGGGMVLIGIAAPFLTIRPAYRPAPPNDSTLCYNIPDNWTCIQPNEAVFSGLIRLNQAQVSDRLVKPGDQLEIELDWETVNTSDRDWSVFVHVVDPVLERPIAQRDMYLGQGLLASSFLPAGERLSNLYVLTVPDGAIAPSELSVQVGLYDFTNDERLVLPDGGNYIQVASIALEEEDGAYPNPLALNFGDQVELVGFEIDRRRLAAGEALNGILYWQALQPLAEDYTFFVQIVAPDTTLYAQADIPGGTSAWSPSEVQAIEVPLAIDPEAEPGLYPLRIGLYRFEENNFTNLQRVTEDGRLTDDFFNLTLIRID